MSFKPALATKVATPFATNTFGEQTSVGELTTVNANATSIAVPANLDPIKAKQIQDELSRASIADLSAYQPASKRANNIEDKLLQEAKGSDLPILADKCANIITIAKGVDIGSLLREDKGFFGKLASKFVNKREKVLAQFNTAAETIDKVLQAVEQNARQIASRAPMFEQMHKECQEDYKMLDNYIYAGKAELVKREAELEALKAEAQANPTDLSLQGRVQDLQFYIQTLSIKVGQWEIDQHDQFQMLPQIRNMQMNAIQLGQKFDTIKGRTLPGWKKKMAMALTISEQKRAADVTNAIDDFSNQLAKENATMLRQTTAQVAQSNQRLQLDMNTIEHVHNEVLGTFDDLLKIAEEGKQQRAQMTTQLLSMKQQMVQKFTA